MLEKTSAQKNAVEMILEYCSTQKNDVLDKYLARDYIDWGHLIYFCDINGLTGLLGRMTTGLEDDRIPFRIGARIQEWEKKYRTRWQNYKDLIKELGNVTTSKPILLKGAALMHTIYRDTPEIRGMGDVDILIPASEEPKIIEWLEDKGFWIREGKNGVTAFRDNVNPRLVVDLHVEDPSKTKRNTEEVYKWFITESFEQKSDLPVKIPRNELMIVYLCKHFCEHEMDFRKVFHQDDIRLIRLFDIKLLLEKVDLDKVLFYAHALNWEEYLFRCMNYLGIFNAEVPSKLLNSEYGVMNELYTPLGPIKWDWDFEERAKRVDRAEWLSNKMGKNGSRSSWYTAKEGNKTPDLINS